MDGGGSPHGGFWWGDNVEVGWLGERINVGHVASTRVLVDSPRKLMAVVMMAGTQCFRSGPSAAERGGATTRTIGNLTISAIPSASAATLRRLRDTRGGGGL